MNNESTVQASEDVQQPYVSMNVFTPVPGGLDALVAFQLDEMRGLSDEAYGRGWLGNEVYRAQDGTRLIVITPYTSREAMQTWTTTERFRQHVAALEPLVEHVSSTPITFVAAHGERLV